MITLEEVKLHLRVDHDDEDTLITSFIEAIGKHIADYCNVPYDELDERVDPSIGKAAALLLIADLYENREAQSNRPLHENLTVNRLLDLQRNMMA